MSMQRNIVLIIFAITIIIAFFYFQNKINNLEDEINQNKRKCNHMMQDKDVMTIVQGMPAFQKYYNTEQKVEQLKKQNDYLFENLRNMKNTRQSSATNNLNAQELNALKQNVQNLHNYINQQNQRIQFQHLFNQRLSPSNISSNENKQRNQSSIPEHIPVKIEVQQVPPLVQPDHLNSLNTSNIKSNRNQSNQKTMDTFSSMFNNLNFNFSEDLHTLAKQNYLNKNM